MATPRGRFASHQRLLEELQLERICLDLEASALELEQAWNRQRARNFQQLATRLWEARQGKGPRRSES